MPSVLICDDSATMRLALRRFLSANGLTVLADAANGEDAVAQAKRLKPDLVTMDVMLPGMDGFKSTQAILKDGPARIVIVSAAGEALQTDLGFRALQCGALDLIEKPDPMNPAGLALWGKSLSETLLALAQLPLGERPAAGIRPRPNVLHRRISAFGIASSTGGPPALGNLFKDLPPSLPFPILVAQHIAPGFTDGLVRWLGTQTKLKVRVAQGGETPEAGTIYLSLDRHDLLWNAGKLKTVPTTGGVCPCGDRLLESMGVLGRQVGGAVLTGMGADGAYGLFKMKESGGLTYAQDAASCVVDGMPAAAVARGATDQRLTLEELCFCITELGRHAG